MQGVEQALEVIELARDGLNPELEWLGVLFNIADMRTVHSREAYDVAARSTSATSCSTTVVRQSIAYAESAERARLDPRPPPDLGAGLPRAGRRAARASSDLPNARRKLRCARSPRPRRRPPSSSPHVGALRLERRAQHVAPSRRPRARSASTTPPVCS